jgi:hypothetical protein
VGSESPRYICTLKIVDPSIYTKSSKLTKSADVGTDSADFATLILYAKRFEDLPIITRIGDIIRIHRSTLRLYNNHRQFNGNIYYNSSWTLFATETHDLNPIEHSSKHFSFDKSEVSLLQNLRKWASQYFGQYNVISPGNDLCVPLSKAAQAKGDFDVVAKIVSMYEMDEYTNEIKLRDQSLTANQPSWFVLTLKVKFPLLKVGDVIRIRSASYDMTSNHKQMLILSHYSNIMNFISCSKMAKELK